MNKKYKIIYISGSRAELGYFRRTLQELNKHPQFDLVVIATSQHTSPKYGSTLDDVLGQGFRVKKIKDLTGEINTLSGMVQNIAINLKEMLKIFEEEKPQALVITADRGEELAGVIIAAHLNIPIFHHGGGNFSGSIDNKLRWAISSLSDYHFASNKALADNLRNMPLIDKNRVWDIGGPVLDDIYLNNFMKTEECAEKFNLDLSKPVVLLCQHPNTEEYGSEEKQIRSSLDAIVGLNYQTIAVGSNADAGGERINKAIEEYAKRNKLFQYFVNLPRREYLGLLKVADVLVGNTSSGFSEAPHFKTPYVCVGTRQRKRLGSSNILYVPYDSSEIKKAIEKALFDKEFRSKLDSLEITYGKGDFYEKFPKVLLKVFNEIHDSDDAG